MTTRNLSSSAMAAFHRLTAEGVLRPDPEQHAAAAALDDLAKRLAARRRSFALPGLGRRHPWQGPQAQGLYLYGPAGRGKSMLMDIFHAGVGVQAGRRIHFHAFMQQVHAAITVARRENRNDPVQSVADGLADGLELLCLDELDITDITDAMLVGRVFERLFARGVVVVATANRHPDELFKDGWNRGPFLPFIALIKDRLALLSLNGPQDFRRNRPAGEDVYMCPLDARAERRIEALWQDVCRGPESDLVLRVHGRDVRFARHAAGALRADFDALCGQPHGPAEFLALAKALDLLVLENVPILSPKRNNEARRLVMLIDALYEARVRLVISAAAQPDGLYPEGDGAFEFGRAASRLEEMRSLSWW
jgi:cell division protein ZapE